MNNLNRISIMAGNTLFGILLRHMNILEVDRWEIAAIKEMFIYEFCQMQYKRNFHATWLCQCVSVSQKCVDNRRCKNNNCTHCWNNNGDPPFSLAAHHGVCVLSLRSVKPKRSLSPSIFPPSPSRTLSVRARNFVLLISHASF